ncbi:hypothetical protein OPT61_g4309 [Boeremia exigua]|uniref:Uncharacterized protein n=1 Tax=Boeremia exigua TaxID=749465 RepID=A0ACC2IEF9_9PLEO|nr:hypothetical protein OPT61_g4309 [Boeremia exigua]
MTLPRLYEHVTLRSHAEIRYIDDRPEGFGGGSPFASGLNTLVSRNFSDYVQLFRVAGEWREHDVDDYKQGRVPDNSMLLQIAMRAALDKMKNLHHFAYVSAALCFQPNPAAHEHDPSAAGAEVPHRLQHRPLVLSGRHFACPGQRTATGGVEAALEPSDARDRRGIHQSDVHVRALSRKQGPVARQADGDVEPLHAVLRPEHRAPHQSPDPLRGDHDQLDGLLGSHDSLSGRHLAPATHACSTFQSQNDTHGQRRQGIRAHASRFPGPGAHIHSQHQARAGNPEIRQHRGNTHHPVIGNPGHGQWKQQRSQHAEHEQALLPQHWRGLSRSSAIKPRGHAAPAAVRPVAALRRRAVQNLPDAAGPRTVWLQLRYPGARVAAPNRQPRAETLGAAAARAPRQRTRRGH